MKGAICLCKPNSRPHFRQIGHVKPHIQETALDPQFFLAHQIPRDVRLSIEMVSIRVLPTTQLPKTRQRTKHEPLQHSLISKDFCRRINNSLSPPDFNLQGMFTRRTIRDLGQFPVRCEEWSPEIRHGEDDVHSGEGLDEGG